jgi:hypothetical protein
LQSAKNKNPGCRGIIARIWHSHQTSHPPWLPEDNIRRVASKVFADRVEDPDIIIQLLLEEKKVNETPRQALNCRPCS